MICLFTFFFSLLRSARLSHANGMSVALISHSKHSCNVDISNETFQCRILLVSVPLRRNALPHTYIRRRIVNCKTRGGGLVIALIAKHSRPNGCFLKVQKIPLFLIVGVATAFNQYWRDTRARPEEDGGVRHP